MICTHFLINHKQTALMATSESRLNVCNLILIIVDDLYSVLPGSWIYPQSVGFWGRKLSGDGSRP